MKITLVLIFLVLLIRPGKLSEVQTDDQIQANSTQKNECTKK